MNSTADFRPEFLFKPAQTSARSQAQMPVNFFMGTNSSAKHLEEALRQQIIAPSEHLLGFFDGVFFDANNKRVGGLALHDYLIVTDQRITMWARDQFKDYVDHFPLADCFIKQSEQKDFLHGRIKLGLVVPDNDEDEPEEANQVEVTFDLVPVADLKQISGLIDVFGSLHRDMIAGGAELEDRCKATGIMFTQLFVLPLQQASAVASAAYAKEANAPTQAQPQTEQDDEDDDEPLVEIVEGAELDDLMTPLSRLDRLDKPDARPLPVAQPPRQRRSRLPVSNPHSTGYGAADSGGNLEDLESELQWLGDGQPYSSSSASTKSNPPPVAPRRAARRQAEANTGDAASNAVARMRQDLNPDSLYNVSRAGRVVWDGVEKLKREGEARFDAKGRPMLQSLKDNGMNVKDVTEFLTAVNNLLDTVNRSPAAREIAMTFINRSTAFMPTFGGLKPSASRPPVEVEDAEDSGPQKSSGPRKVERRGTSKPNAPTSQIDPFNPPRYKVSIRKKEAEVETGTSEVNLETDQILGDNSGSWLTGDPAPAQAPVAISLKSRLGAEPASQVEIAPEASTRRRLVPVRAQRPRPEELDN